MFRLDIDQGVATLVIDRGGRRNAIPIAEWSTLERLLTEAAAKARLVVLRSADPGSFCAGADLTELPALMDDVRRRHIFRGAMGSALARLRGLSKPTVAIVEGGCFGAGVSLAMACDLRVAAPNARFAITPARFGISYPAADLHALLRLVGPGQAARLVYTAQAIDAEEALRIGLVETIDASADCGAETVAQIAGNAPYSLVALKSAMAGGWDCDKKFDEAFASADFSEGWDAFKSGRTPQFTR